MRTTVALLLFCVLAATAAAQQQKIFPYDYEQHDFSNGMRLITVPTDFPNVVALYIVVQTGSRNEIEPGKTGFAHFFEHMMFRGTKEFPPDKYNSVLKEAGASFNAFTSDDLTAYHTTFSKPDLETILRMEADRFQNLEYAEGVFKTEALAVLGEYNKNSASPMMKISETLRGLAFTTHTYKHTTMGFLEDIKDMPNQYDYSRKFFDRYYRPEYTTLIVAGDVDKAAAKKLVEKYWGPWKRGSYTAPVPAEPPQKEAQKGHIDWPTPTLPWLVLAFRAPAYSDTTKETATLDLITFLGFSENSPLYRKLVLEEQKVDVLRATYQDHIDPYLLTVMTRVKKQEDMDSVREQILSALAGFKDNLVKEEELDKVKRHIRYSFALAMDNSEAIASTLAHYVALRRTPETMNRVFELYSQITPEDVRAVARKYFLESGRTTVTLTGASK